MSAIAKSTVSTVPPATAWRSSSSVTRPNLLSARLELRVELVVHGVGRLAMGPESVLRPEHPPEAHGRDHDDHRDRGVVHVLPVELVTPRDTGRGEREAEDDRDEADPEDREGVHPPVLPPERPRAGLEPVAHPPA